MSNRKLFPDPSYFRDATVRALAPPFRAAPHQSYDEAMLETRVDKAATPWWLQRTLNIPGNALAMALNATINGYRSGNALMRHPINAPPQNVGQQAMDVLGVAGMAPFQRALGPALAAKAKPASIFAAMPEERGALPAWKKGFQADLSPQNPFNTVRAYHGTNSQFETFDPQKMGSRGMTDEKAFFFGDRETGNFYGQSEFRPPPSEVAQKLWKKHETPDGRLRINDYNAEMRQHATQTGFGNIIPADVDTSNFKTIKLPRYSWLDDEGAKLKAAIDKARSEGYHGAIIKGMEDGSGSKATQYAVFPEAQGKGVVRSATTGNALFGRIGYPAPFYQNDELE